MTSDYSVKKATGFCWPSNDVESLSGDRTDFLDKYLLGKNVLDIGCGCGGYTEYMRRLGKNASGTDITDEFIQKARGNYPDADFSVGDIVKGLPFGDGEFDTVVAFDILEHVDDQVAIDELIRVAGQRIIISVPLEFDMRVGRHGLIYWPYQDVTHLRYYSEQKLRSLLEPRGINIVHTREIDPVELRGAYLNSLLVGSFFRRVAGRILSMIPERTYCQNIICVGEVS